MNNSNNILICSDLHNTLLFSNKAWIDAFSSFINIPLNDIAKKVYQKQSRKQMAIQYNIDYHQVLEKYHTLVEPNTPLLKLLNVLNSLGIKIIVVSSASAEKVEKDYKKIEQFCPIEAYYNRDSFDKKNYDSWNNLRLQHNVEHILYIGNDYEEDIINHPFVSSLIVGHFLKELIDNNILKNRSI